MARWNLIRGLLEDYEVLWSLQIGKEFRHALGHHILGSWDANIFFLQGVIIQFYARLILSLY